jgi:arylformamidase
VEILDVSVPIRPGMPVWPGDPELELERVVSLAAGGALNLTRIAGTAHLGTHVDAPVHFVDGGAGVEQLSLDVLVGPCLVVAATGADGELQPDALASVPAGVQRVLFKTSNSELWSRPGFVEDHLSLSAAAAEEVVRRGIRLVGIDYLTIGGIEAHRTLLRAGVVPLEGLDLRGVEPGPYRLVCLPLKLVGADGAPARTVLVRD